MEINRCFGCMEEVGQYPCTHCGYDPQKNVPLEYVLKPGAILNGKYLVGKVLGQGGFGITYVGWDLALERKVAIKEYFPSGQVSRHHANGSTLQWYSTALASDAKTGGMEMFLKEARKMSRVDAIPQVVGVRDLFQENETAYIVMNFAEGETLKDRLKRTGPMSWEEAKKVFLPAIGAMERVHKAGLIHRDISPDNLMLRPDGEVQILDLGAAKDLNLNSGASSMQVAKSGFSPLEQYTQRGGSGTWTDVYAMAATMYYALTGLLPPAAVDRMEEDRIRWDLPQLEALPKTVVQALRRAMTVLQKNRTQTMTEFQEELAGVSRPAGPEPWQKQTEGGKPSSPEVRWEPPVGTASENKTPGFPVKKWLIPGAAAAVILAICLTVFVVVPRMRYKKADSYLKRGQYAQAYDAFTALKDYSDSEDMARETVLQWARSLDQAGKYELALSKLELISQDSRTAELAREIRMNWIEQLEQTGDYQQALTQLEKLPASAEVTLLTERIYYLQGKEFAEGGQYSQSYSSLKNANGYGGADALAVDVVKEWADDVIEQASPQKAREFTGAVDLTKEESQAVFDVVSSKAFYTVNTLTGGWTYNSNDFPARIILLDALTGDIRLKNDLRTLFTGYDPQESEAYVTENIELVKRLWELPVAQDVSMDNWSIYGFLLGNWRADNGKYIRFYTESGSEFTYTYFTLPFVPKPAGTDHYRLSRKGDAFTVITLSWEDKDDKELAKVFDLTLTGPDTMNVYCYQDGRTYTVRR